VEVRENAFTAQVQTTRRRTLDLKASFVAAQYAPTRQGSLTVDGNFMADGIMFLMTVSDGTHHQLIPVAGMGMAAPALQATDTDGNQVTLAAFQNQKKVVLVFYRGKG